MKNSIVCVCLFLGLIMNAQNIKNYKCKVIDNETNSPMLGVTVRLINTSEGTTTNEKGDFEISTALENSYLLISYTGYEEIKISLTNLPDKIYLQGTLNIIDEVVVSANRQSQKRINVPLAMSTISAKKIEQMQPISIDEVLNQKSGVLMVDLGNEQHMMAIRQPITTKGLFLYLEDGIPIRTTGIFNHNALLEMNLTAVKNIEIIRGSYSSLFGSEAIGGAVNFITKNPSKTPTAAVGFRRNNWGYKRFDFSASTTEGKTGFYFSGYKSEIEDGIREYGDYEKEAFTAKVTHQFNDKLFWSTVFTNTDYFSETSGSIGLEKFLAKDYSSNHTFTNREVEAKRLSSTLSYDWDEVTSTTFSLFYRDNTIAQNPSYRISNRTANDSFTNGEINDNSFKSYGFIGQHNFMPFEKFKLSLGLSLDKSPNEFRADRISVYRNTEGIFESFTNTDIVLSNYKTDLLNVGTYFSGEYLLNSQVRFTMGARYDKFHYDFKNDIGETGTSFLAPDTKNTFSSFTPRVGFLYKPGNDTSIYANYSRGFVAPGVGELYEEVEVPFLEPSTFNNFEIGAKFSSADRKLYADMAVYYLKGNNEIVSIDILQNGIDSSENRNAGETEHYGVEFALNYQIIKDLSYRINGAYSKHKYVDFVTEIEEGKIAASYNGKDIPGAPKWVVNSELSYQPNYIKGLTMSLEYQFVDDYYTDELNTISYEGYGVFNSRISYEVKGIKIWSNVLNVFDDIYATRANTAFGSTSYTPGNPQTFNIGISYTIK